jgi:hypothetical protein
MDKIQHLIWAWTSQLYMIYHTPPSAQDRIFECKVCDRSAMISHIILKFEFEPNLTTKTNSLGKR